MIYGGAVMTPAGASVLRNALFVAGLAISAQASASPEDLFGYGPRTSAMGATGAATALGYEATYANPALLSLERERKINFGFSGATFNLHADGPGLPGRVSVLPAKGVLIGADLPIPFSGILKDRIGAAFAFYTPSDAIVRGRILYPETPQYPLLSDRAQSVALRVGLGADIGYGIRLGAGFAALAEIAGNVLVATDASGRVGSRVDDQLIATYAPIGGAAYEHSLGDGKIRVGGTVRGTLGARVAVAIDATKLSSLNIPIFNIAGLAQYDPFQSALEVAWIRRDISIILGATYKRWSDYPGPIEPTIVCPDDNPGCGLQPTRLAFSDTLVPRVGFEKRIEVTRTATLALRAGYFFEPTPIPSDLAASHAFNFTTRGTDAIPTRSFDSNRHVVTFGLGVSLVKPLHVTLDWSSQIHVLQSRDITLEGNPATSPNLHGIIWVNAIALGVGF